MSTTEIRPRTEQIRRLTATAAFVALGAVVAAPLVAMREDPRTQPALQAYLDRMEVRLFSAWVLCGVAAIAWLCLALGVRRMLPPSAGRDFFLALVPAAQVALWTGSSLDVATVRAEARGVPLSVHYAFTNAGHSVTVAGTAFTGLALLGLARALRATPVLGSRLFRRLTAVAGVLLVPAGAGPVSWAVTILWLLVIGAVLLRSPSLPATTAASPTPVAAS
jgi:hypothetical protein